MGIKNLFGIKNKSEQNKPIIQQLVFFVQNNAVNEAIKLLTNNKKSDNPIAIPYTPAAITSDFSDVVKCSHESNLTDSELAALICVTLLKKHPNSISALLEQNGYAAPSSDRILYLSTYVTTLHSLQEFVSAGVKKYEISTCGDRRVCPQCAKHDGKKHLVAKAVIGKNAPPFCDHCRCIIMADTGGIS